MTDEPRQSFTLNLKVGGWAPQWTRSSEPAVRIKVQPRRASSCSAIALFSLAR